jgi:hypothetical protein
MYGVDDGLDGSRGAWLAGLGWILGYVGKMGSGWSLLRFCGAWRRGMAVWLHMDIP